MIKLIHNEIIKLVKRPKTLIVFICFVVLVGLVCFGTYKNDVNMAKYESPEFQIKNMEESISYMKEELKNGKVSEEQKKLTEQDIANMEEQIKTLKENKDKPYDYKNDINTQIKKIDDNISHETDESRKNSLSLEKQKLEKQLELGISPKDTNRLNGFIYLNELITILGAIFLAAGIAIFSSDMVSGEYTPATMKFLLIQPVSRSKVLFAKYITVLISVMTAIFSVEGISYIVMGLIFGFGNSKNPVITGARYVFDISKTEGGLHPMKIVPGSQYLTTIGSFTVKVLLFQLLFMIAVTTFVFMISTVFKSSMVSMAVSTILIIVFSIVQNIPGASKLAPYLFTIYGDGSNLLNGNYSMSLKLPSLTPAFGVVVLIMWIVVSYTIAHTAFVKKDILI
ncbi:ABC transporter permease subunit [Candidatus Clostridium stratigraminis]|uniref:ABC transporter permease subunit n=1 Tax=Candidatus Clostridium stratigraminis TaxID=3381661 RepID=A0ABW8T7S6_9CLOT